MQTSAAFPTNPPHEPSPRPLHFPQPPQLTWPHPSLSLTLSVRNSRRQWIPIPRQRAKQNNDQTTPNLKIHVLDGSRHFDYAARLGPRLNIPIWLQHPAPPTAFISFRIQGKRTCM